MGLELLGYIELPGNLKPGGFDDAALHCASGRLYVAHTANDALDVIDCVHDRHLHSIPNLTGVASAFLSDEQNLVFTSNRGENTIGILGPDNEAGLAKVGVGIRPNGLAYDPGKDLLLAANVGDPDIPDSFTLSIVNVKEQRMNGQCSRARPDSMDSVRRTSRLNAALIPSGSTPHAISPMPSYLKHIAQRLHRQRLESCDTSEQDEGQAEGRDTGCDCASTGQNSLLQG